MLSMFSNAGAFNQPLNNWDVGNVQVMDENVLWAVKFNNFCNDDWVAELYNNKSIAMSIFSQSAGTTHCSKGENSTSVTDPRLHRIMVVNSIHNGASLKSRRELATVAGGETLMLEEEDTKLSY